MKHKRNLKVKICFYCKTVYKTRKDCSRCPKCGRPHHVRRIDKWLAIAGLPVSHNWRR
jgi:uncharacterized paraquat-inducible protein A